MGLYDECVAVCSGWKRREKRGVEVEVEETEIAVRAVVKAIVVMAVTVMERSRALLSVRVSAWANAWVGARDDCRRIKAGVRGKVTTIVSNAGRT